MDEDYAFVLDADYQFSQSRQIHHVLEVLEIME